MDVVSPYISINPSVIVSRKSIIHPNLKKPVLLKFSLQKETNLSSAVFTVVQPNRSMENFLSLTSLLKTLSKNKKYTYKCFVGEFNFKDIKWPSMSTHKDEESKETKFIETIQDYFLYQHVTPPKTRCRSTDRPSTIDLVLTNEEQQIGNLNAIYLHSVKVTTTFYHSSLSVNLMSQKRYQNTSTTRQITNQ